MANFSGAAQGFLDFTQQQQQRQMQQAYIQKMQQDAAARAWQQQQQQQALQRSQEARAGAGRLMYDQMGKPPQPPMPGASSPGGTPNGGQPPQGGGQPGGPPPGGPEMMQPPPGAGAPAGGPQMSPAPAQPPQPMPWRPMPQPAPGGGAPAGAGAPPQIGSPPGQTAPGAEAGPAGGVAQPRPFDLKSIIGTLQKQGVPPEKVMDMLDEMTPIMNAQNKQELEQFKVQHQLQGDVLKFAHQRILELQGDKRIAIAEKEQASKATDREARNATAKAKLEAKLHGAVGGKDNLKRTAFEYDQDGNPTGIIGITKSGKTIRKNLAGEDIGPDQKSNPKAEQNRMRQANLWRSEMTALINESNPKNKPRIDALKAKIAGSDKPAAGAPKGGDIAAKVKAAGGAYEPDKYDYRINPTTGAVEKKAKGG